MFPTRFLSKLRPTVTLFSSRLPSVSSFSTRIPRNEDAVNKKDGPVAITNENFYSTPSDLPVYSVAPGYKYKRARDGNFIAESAEGPFGTMEEPVLVFSENNERIVGCNGNAAVHHGSLWFNLKLGMKHVCRDCGQVFALVNESNFKKWADVMGPERYQEWLAKTERVVRSDGAELTTIGQDNIEELQERLR